MNTIDKLNNKLNDAINRSSNWKIYFVTLLIVTVIFYIMFRIVTHWGLSTPEYEKITPLITLKISFITSAIMSIMITLMFSMSKQSDKFWGGVKELEKLIDEKNTRDELEELYQTKFKELHKLCAGPPHFTEMKRLKSIMEMKYKLIK